MNRVGLKDYLLNHADDNDLLDCAKAWDTANEYGQFDTYKSLDDMCEDRCEVASAAQAVDTGERHHEDEQRDNSEIGE